MEKDYKKLGDLTEKEIYEIPTCLKKALDQKNVINQVSNKIIEHGTIHIYIIGAGSSYHAGFAMSYMFNRITRIPTFPEYSMEFQYLINPILTKDDCVIALSQSGETKDTIQSVKLAKELGCLNIGITNDSNSTLSRICDNHIFLQCEDEKSVLATKTYVSELSVLAMLALEIAKEKKTLDNEEYNRLLIELIRIPEKIHSILPIMHDNIKRYSKYFKFTTFCFILGSGSDYATAMEAALKLKEGARIFGQAYSTAEFPHGPITLADSKTAIIAIIPHEEDTRKINLLHLLKRIKERNATIFAVYEGMQEENLPESIDFGIAVPDTFRDLQPIVMILAIQLLTLEISRINGINCDTPKFLSKVSGI
jgi:glucosamine--fructose-6-phosphate aminotransferase (isomerizing)